MIYHLFSLFPIILLSVTCVFGQVHFSDVDLDPVGNSDLGGKFSVFEIEVYTEENEDDLVFLKNGYAKSKLQNPSDWKDLINNHIAVEINLVYTKYPRDKELWRTNYRKLLTDRLKSLFAIDSTLNSSNIEWNIVLQTSCNTEPEAMAMLHGFEIVFEPLTVETPDTTIVTQDSIVPVKSKEEKNAERYVRKFDRMLKRTSDKNDSTVIKILDRHKNWKNSLVVMDWSGSMHGFSMNVMRWHAENFKESGISNVVLFTDSDRTKRGKIGDSGGIFFSEASDFKKVVRIMRQNRVQLYNRKIEENNIEGLIKAIDRFPDFDELVMIADNRSCMKDYCLCELVKKPIKIVLCGTYFGINPQYVNLAYRLGGSLHTMESDIKGFEAFKVEGTELNIDGWRFKFNPKTNLFEAINKSELIKKGYQDCTKFYKVSGRCKKMIAKFFKN